ncbi:hypothetical protein NL676_018220 [Syzygium grande]|nr:hypothetical protein NL676_018220 [Syzygium grande]
MGSNVSPHDFPSSEQNSDPAPAAEPPPPKPHRQLALSRKSASGPSPGPAHQGERPGPPDTDPGALRGTNLPADPGARPPLRRRDHRVAPPLRRALHHRGHRLRQHARGARHHRRGRAPPVHGPCVRPVPGRAAGAGSPGAARPRGVPDPAAGLPAGPEPAERVRLLGRRHDQRLPPHALHGVAVAAGGGGGGGGGEAAQGDSWLRKRRPFKSSVFWGGLLKKLVLLFEMSVPEELFGLDQLHQLFVAPREIHEKSKEPEIEVDSHFALIDDPPLHGWCDPKAPETRAVSTLTLDCSAETACIGRHCVVASLVLDSGWFAQFVPQFHLARSIDRI